MNDETILIICFVVFLLVDFGLFYLEYLRLERQHKKHMSDLSTLFDDFCGKLYNDIVNYLIGD